MFKFFYRPSIFVRLLDLLTVMVLLLMTLLVLTAPARAGNTTFLTDKNGNVIFPFSPPNRANSTPGFIDNMIIGQTTPALGYFTQVIVSGGTPVQCSAATCILQGLSAAQGGIIELLGGPSSTSANAGGAAKVLGGVPGATGAGGAAQIAGGAGGSTSGTGGAASLIGGAGTAGNAAGGVASIAGGAGQGTGAGGAATHTGGASGAGATGNGGLASVTGGAALSTNGTGGAASLVGGAGAGTGNGGAVAVTGGAAGATGVGGAVAIAAGAPTAGAGSNVTVTASAGVGSTNAGGNVNLVPGAAASTGAPGTVQVNGNPGLICHNATLVPNSNSLVFFIATRPMLIEQISAVWTAAAGATSTVGVTHDTGTGAPGSGTDMLATDFNLNTTGNTVNVGSLTATVATLTLAAGDRVSMKAANATGSTTGFNVTFCAAPQ